MHKHHDSLAASSTPLGVRSAVPARNGTFPNGTIRPLALAEQTHAGSGQPDQTDINLASGRFCAFFS
jgi:hypothetical protein